MNQFSVRNHLKDTAFCVSLLSTGARPEHFATWYEYCQNLVVEFSDNLKKDHYSETEIEQLSYAQCALLDEAALKIWIIPSVMNGKNAPCKCIFSRIITQVKLFVIALKCWYEKVSPIQYW